MKISALLFSAFTICNLFHFETLSAQEMSKDEIKAKLKAFTPEARSEAISRADIFEKKMDKLHRETPEKVSEIDMLNELQQICGNHFNYVHRGANTEWPTVSCKYHRSEKTLGGSTNKFLCDFNEIKKSGEAVVKTRKVKYLAFTGLKNSELLPSLLASTMSRMLGFPTESYCPAVVKCENCPSNMPYEFGKSQGRPSQDTFEFQEAMVEIPADLMNITPNIPRRHPRRPHGLDFNELFKVTDTNHKSAREKAIEREVWLLWLNFIIEDDAHSSNQRIACDKASVSGTEVHCDRPVVYTHDYGRSFFERFQFNKWKSYPPVIQSENDSCRGGMTPAVMKAARGKESNSLEIQPLISAEAKDLLVSRLRHISDKQWADIARIANIDRLMKVSPEEFLKAVKTKIEIMEQVRCAPFDSGTTVFGKFK